MNGWQIKRIGWIATILFIAFAIGWHVEPAQQSTKRRIEAKVERFETKVENGLTGLAIGIILLIAIDITSKKNV